MEIKFTKSIKRAIESMLWLSSGTLLSTNGVKRVARHDWYDFDFFDRIEASPIRRMKRVVSSSGELNSWKLERTVTFFYNKALVAIVYLVGVKTDEGNDDLDKGSLWYVVKIGYFQKFGGGPSDFPEDWEEVRFERAPSTLELVEA